MGAESAGMRTEVAAAKPVFEIERERRWRIWALFGLLVALTFAAAYVAAVVVEAVVFFAGADPTALHFSLSWWGLGATLLFALGTAAIYWFGAQVGARDRLLHALKAQPLDPHDRYHQRLANIVEEMRIAGGAPGVEAVVVPTLGMNAFAFSDLHGKAVIGVTEGALSRLSRQQLEGVVAHEMAHVLSGSHVTATVACMLFGIYTSLGDKLGEATDTAGSEATLVGVGALLLRALLALVMLASRVVNGAISREGECAADLAAVRYTRDPVSLAQALRTIARHPGGAGYIPVGLEPLCIRADREGGSGGWIRLLATHPPVEERIAALLALANMGPSEFQGQARQADESLTGREHWAPPPAAASGAQVPLLGALGLPPTAGTPQSPPPVGPEGGAAVCPSCGAALRSADYEGVSIQVCAACGGRFARSEQVARIAARREVAFTDDQQRLADLIASKGDELRRAAAHRQPRLQAKLIACPGCGCTMIRRLFNYQYALEVDFCEVCDAYWFDKDELEVLQILNERLAQ